MIKKTTIFQPIEEQTFTTLEEFKDYCTLGGTKPDFKDQLIAGGIDITDDSVYQEALIFTPDGTDPSMKITIAYADQEQLDSVADSYVDFLEELDYERPVYLNESTNHLF